MNYWTIIGLVLATIFSFVKEIITKENVVKSIWYKISIPVLILITLIVSIISEIDKVKSDNKIQNQRAEEYKSLLERSNKAIESSETANDKLNDNIGLTSTNIRMTNNSLERLEEIGNKNRKIVASLEKELSLSQSIVEQSEKLLSENRLLTQRQIKQMENEDRALNPAFPFHFLAAIQLDFSSDKAQKILNYVDKFMPLVKTDSFVSKYKIKRWFAYNDKTKITAVRIINFHESFDSLRILTDAFTHFRIGFIPDSTCTNFSNASISKSVLNTRTFLRKRTNPDEVRKQFATIKIDWEYKTIFINYYFTYIIANSIFEKSNYNLGLRDLKDSYLYITMPHSLNNSELKVAQIYIGRQFRDPIPLSIGVPETNYFKGNTLFHKFMSHEIEWKNYSRQDAYNIYYYGEGTEAEGYVDPDFN